MILDELREYKRFLEAKKIIDDKYYIISDFDRDNFKSLPYITSNEVITMDKTKEIFEKMMKLFKLIIERRIRTGLEFDSINLYSPTGLVINEELYNMLLDEKDNFDHVLSKTKKEFLLDSYVYLSLHSADYHNEKLLDVNGIVNYNLLAQMLLENGYNINFKDFKSLINAFKVYTIENFINIEAPLTYTKK